VLVQPATVARWHREGFRGCWRRRSRRPGRPCINSQLQALIRRLATENRLWGAPRIHGELLKLGIAVSERTVLRYLPDRLTAPSQTWRTFLANHLGDLAFISPVRSSYAPGDEDVVDACGLSFRPAPLLRDGPYASDQGAVVDWFPSLRRMSLGWRVAQDHLHDRTRTRPSSGRDPPTALQLAPRRTGGGSFRRCLHLASTANEQSETIRSPAARSPSAVLRLSLCPIRSSTSSEGRKRLRFGREAHVCVVIRAAIGLLAKYRPSRSSKLRSIPHYERGGGTE
jgi:hypothetical protein